jgi:hypothetical protein
VVKRLSIKTSPYAKKSSIPGDLVITESPPNRPANKYFCFSKKKTESKIRAINNASGAPTDLITKNRGRKRKTVTKNSGFVVILNCFKIW